MQARRRARTWPPVTIEEFGKLNYRELVGLAMERGLKATGLKRTDLVIGLYWHCHELDRAMRR